MRVSINNMKKMMLNNEQGFVLLAAIIACLILLAIGMLVINMSTGNLIGSSVNIGTKKAQSATESGVHRLVENFQNTSETWTLANGYSQNVGCNGDPAGFAWQSITGGADSHSQYAVCLPTQNRPPLTLNGYAGTALCIYDISVAGRNTSYNSLNIVDVGMGVFCPGASGSTPTTYR
jgi:hypothetical protein